MRTPLQESTRHTLEGVRENILVTVHWVRVLEWTKFKIETKN
jgi:hypothetical protein